MDPFTMAMLSQAAQSGAEQLGGAAQPNALQGQAQPQVPGAPGAVAPQKKSPLGAILGPLTGAILGGISEANERARQGQIQGLQAGAEGAQRMGQAQAAGLAQLMQGYQGILR